MKLLQVCLAYPPNHNGGGAALSAQALTDALLRTGHQVAVVAPKLSGAAFRRPRLFGEHDILPNKARISFLGTWVQVGFNAINPGALFVLPGMVRNSDVVIIHGLRTFSGSLAAICCVLAQKPYIVFPHGMAVRRWRSLLKKYVYDRLFGNWMLKRAGALVCLSSVEREEVIRLTKRDPAEVPVIDATHLESVPPKLHQPRHWHKAQILLLGRLVPEKSIELVIEAVAQRDLRSRYEICIAGPEENEQYCAKLRRRAEALSVTVRFTGGVYGDERNRLVMDSHILALVSEYESYGRVAMEALRMGTPVLVTDTCGIARDLDRRTGVVVPRTVEAIGHALAKLSAGDFEQLRNLRHACVSDASSRTEDMDVAVVDSILQSAGCTSAPSFAGAR